MDGPQIYAQYIPGLGQPGLSIDEQTHALSIEKAEQIINYLSFAVLRARVDAKKRATSCRHTDPEAELVALIDQVNAELASPAPFFSPSPASEVSL